MVQAETAETVALAVWQLSLQIRKTVALSRMTERCPYRTVQTVTVVMAVMQATAAKAVPIIGLTVLRQLTVAMAVTAAMVAISANMKLRKCMKHTLRKAAIILFA